MSRLEYFESMLSEGKICRREFLARVSALGLAVAVSPALLRSSARAATPKKGGRLRIGCTGGAASDTLDPGTLPATWSELVNFEVRNCLVEIDDKFTPIPELAEGWEPTPDAKKWMFKLRKGVEFHNGKTMDAEDIIYSINHHRRKDSKSAAKGILTPIEEIKADGKYAVVFSLNGGNADFPSILSDYHLTIVPSGTSGAEWDKGIGTGGYILQRWEPGVRAFAKRNPNYWKKGRAHFDEVETLNISDTTARTSALKSGAIDHMERCDRKTFHLLEKIKDIQALRISGTTHYTMPMLTDRVPYDNNDVRLALKYAIDREQMLKIIMGGLGYVGNDHPIGKNQRYFASALPQRKFDPDKAKFHLKKAGMEGHTFKLHVADAVFAGAVDAAILYREKAAKAGIKINVVREPDDGYWENVWRKKEWCFCYWGGRPTEDWMFSTTYASDAPWNDAHWKNERFNKLLKEARAELDEKKRREMYVEMQRIVRNYGGTVIPVFADLVEASRKNLQHREVAGNYQLDGLRLPERWWFA